MNKLFAASAAVLIGGISVVGLSTAAFADTAPTTEVASSASTSTTTVPTTGSSSPTTTSTAPAPSPVTVETQAPQPSASPSSQTPTPTSTAPTTTISKPGHGETYPGPKHFKSYDVTVVWYGASPDSIATPFAQPQTLTPITCGGIVQTDVYTISSQKMQDHYWALIHGGKLVGTWQDAEFSPHDYTVTALPECVTDDATAAVAVSDATCDVPGTPTLTGTFLASQPLLDTTPGAHTVTVTSATGHAFKDGSTTETLPYTVTDKINCVTPSITVTASCPVGATVEYNTVVENATEGITWTQEDYLGGTAHIANAASGTKIVGPLGNNGFINEEGQGVFPVSHQTDPNVDCALPPVTPPHHTTPAPPVNHTTPGTPAKPVTPVVPVVHTASAPVAHSLAFTGSENTVPEAIIGGSVLLLGLGLVIAARRKARQL